MLYHVSRRVLRYMKCGHSTVVFPDEFPSSVGHPDDVTEAVLRLKEKGFLRNYLNESGRPVGITLTLRSRHPVEFIFIDFFEYLFQNWTSILALLISGASLALALAAFYSGSNPA